MKTAKEILKETLPSFGAEWIKDMKPELYDGIIEAMEEYRSQPTESKELPGDDKVNNQSKVSCKGNSHAMRYHHMLEQFRDGAKWMRSIASPLLASKDARIRELEEALIQANENIKVWHGDEMYDVYYNNAPEMKKIKKALTPPKN